MPGIGVGIGLDRSSGVTSDMVLPSYSWTPQDISGALFWLPTSSASAQMKEHNGATFTSPPGPTRPTAIGDDVGYIDEPISAFKVYAGTSGTKPTLASDATLPCYLAFASGDNYLVEHSAKFFRYWNSNRIGFILVAVKFDSAANGVLATIVDTINNTGSNVGFNLRKDTNGQITFQIGNGTGTLATVSSGTSVEDGAWHYVRVWINGGTVSMKLDGGTTQTASASALFDGDCTNDVSIGRKANGTGPLLGSMSHLVIGNGTSVSDADYAKWLAYVQGTSLNAGSLARITASGNSLTPDQASGLHLWYDFGDVTTMWTTSAKSAQVSANADPIGFVETKQTLPTGCGSYQRQLTQSTNAKRPTYATNVSNSRGAGLWAGAAVQPETDPKDFTGENDLILNEAYSPGAQTTIFIAKNTDDTLGSHVLKASAYAGVAGTNYSNKTKGGAFLHYTNSNDAGGVGAINSGTMANAGTGGINIIVHRQDLRTGKMWVDNIYANTALSGSGTSTGAGLFQVVSIGRPAILGWDMAGNILEILHYNVAHSDSTIRKLVNQLATKWGIANVPTTLTVTP